MWGNTYSLDDNGLLPLSITIDRDNGLRVVVSVARVTRNRLIQHLRNGLTIHCNAEISSFVLEDDKLVAHINAFNGAIRLCLHGRMLIEWDMNDGNIQHPVSHLLTVSETRMLGQYPHPQIPYTRDELDSLSDTVRLRTDLHTHLSAQISSDALLQVAAQADIAYPVELLEHIGIDTSNYPHHPTPSFRFSPAMAQGLACEQGAGDVAGVKVAALYGTAAGETLMRHMHVAADNVVPFDTLERQIYRMRNPLTKHPACQQGIILAVARDYQRQGIDYAELAVTAALDADWLAAAIPAITQAEQETGVRLRLLAAIPRSLSPQQMLQRLDIIKHVMQHPYVVGMDILGYESNKTRNVYWALSNIARWIGDDDERRDLIIRVHAGENGKNPDNVGEVLDIATRYGLRIRIGHAAYGHTQAYLTQARELTDAGLLIIEFNPDSNIAVNNIDALEELPLQHWMQAGVAAVVASDGAGIYQTDNQQLLASALFSGLSADDVANIQAIETAHIARQDHIYTKALASYRNQYSDDTAFITAMRACSASAAMHSMERLRHKRPLLIAGASGSSWARMSEDEQMRVRDGITALVNTLDAHKVYFVMGRVKHEGIGQILDDALTQRAIDHPNFLSFDVIGMLSGAQNMPTLAEHLNGIVPLKGALMSVPVEMTALLQHYGGCALYIGGSAFTRDFIRCSEDAGILFGVMANVTGASGDKAHILHTSYTFDDAQTMLTYTQAMLHKADKKNPLPGVVGERKN